jgi:hypothetical protein
MPTCHLFTDDGDARGQWSASRTRTSHFLVQDNLCLPFANDAQQADALALQSPLVSSADQAEQSLVIPLKSLEECTPVSSSIPCLRRAIYDHESALGVVVVSWTFFRIKKLTSSQAAASRRARLCCQSKAPALLASGCTDIVRPCWVMPP